MNIILVVSDNSGLSIIMLKEDNGHEISLNNIYYLSYCSEEGVVLANWWTYRSMDRTDSRNIYYINCV